MSISKRTRKNKKSPVKSPAFIFFAIMLFVLCGAAASGGIYRVYMVAQAYESSTAEYAAQRELSAFENGDLDLLLRRCPPKLSYYENTEDYKAALSEYWGEGKPELLRTGSDSFEISVGGNAAAFLTVECGKKAGAYGIDKWSVNSFKLAELPTEDYEIYYPPGVSLKINGIMPLQEDMSECDDPQSPFFSLPQELAAEPTACCKVQGLYITPQIEAESENGEKLEISREKNTFHITAEPKEATVKALTELGLSAAEGYARFITNDATLDETLPFFLPNSKIYTHLTQFYNGWYNDHEEFRFENANFSAWRAYDERHVSCEISFDYYIKMGRREFTYPSRYDMYFVKSGSGWLVCALVVKQ